MSLAVVARYSDMIEAQVVRTALVSSGIPAWVADEGYGRLDPFMQVALQGYRVCVPAIDLEIAREVLTSAQSAGAEGPPSDIVVPPRTLGWTALAMIPGLVMPEVGFLIEGVRRRRDSARRALVAGLPVYLAVAAITGLIMLEEAMDRRNCRTPGLTREECAALTAEQDYLLPQSVESDAGVR